MTPQSRNPAADAPSGMAQHGCRNCGQPAGPAFCGHCGQELADGRISTLRLLQDLLSDWFSLDGRLVRSLRGLARPGRLTESYLAGRRASYLRPFRLYVVASILLFSSLLSLQPPDASKIELYIGGQLVTQHSTDRERRRLTFFEAKSPLSRWMADYFAGDVERLRQLPPQELIDDFFGGLRRTLPLALILFLPLLALALKLLYLRRKRFFVEHLLFAIHFQSALFLALTLTWALASLFGLNLLPRVAGYALAGMSILLVYLPLALRRVYRQRWPTTLAKTLALVFCYGQLLQLPVGLSFFLITLRL